MAEQLHRLNRKRARERGNITCFSSSIHSFTVETARDGYEHYKGRLEGALEHMLKLHDIIHDLLTDEEYYADVTTCEECIDIDKRAIQKAGHGHEIFNPATPDNLMSSPTFPPLNHRDLVSTVSFSHQVWLPLLKLEPFSRDIESWHGFRNISSPQLTRTLPCQ